MSTNSTKTFNYGHAVELLREGKLVARKNWSSKGVFIFMRPADQLKASFVTDTVKSLPAAYKEWVRCHLSESDEIVFSRYLCLKAADNTIVNGWIASTTDILADDWYEIDPNEGGKTNV